MQLDLHDDVIAEAIVDVIKSHTADFVTRLAALEVENAILKSQVKALEDRPPVMGPQGERGLPGDPGPPGAPGATGESGPAGPQGPAGPPGSPGERGERGEIGPAGPAGESIRGERGEKGLDGERGERGEVGPAGPQGIAGRDGLPGVPGATGEKGLDGKDGAVGAAGRDGRDGTLENLAIKAVDYRTIGFYYKGSAGDDVAVGTFRLDHTPMYPDPNDIAFKHDRDYVICDLVFWGGKNYYAKMPGVGIVPGDGSRMSELMWGLFSDRGRQGKTGDKGLQGEQGPRGERGERGPERWQGS